MILSILLGIYAHFIDCEGIHFGPKIDWMLVILEKFRYNPGSFLDRGETFHIISYNISSVSDPWSAVLVMFHPLASKGFWSSLLQVGDFYYEIAIQLIEACIRR